MRWRAHFFLQKKYESDIWREDLGFKLKAFEKVFLEMIPNIKF